MTGLFQDTSQERLPRAYRGAVGRRESRRSPVSPHPSPRPRGSRESADAGDPTWRTTVLAKVSGGPPGWGLQGRGSVLYFNSKIFKHLGYFTMAHDHLSDTLAAPPPPTRRAILARLA